MNEMPTPYQDTEPSIGTSDTLPSQQHSLSEAHIGHPETDKINTPRIELARGAGRIIPSTQEIMEQQDRAAAEEFVRANKEYLQKSGYDMEKWESMMRGEQPTERPEPVESGIISSLRRGIDRLSGVFSKKQPQSTAEISSRPTLESPVSPRVRESINEFMKLVPDESDRAVIQRILKEVEAREAKQESDNRTHAA
ncbi:hypothetical protein KKG46_04985 [Patescibacteria group bacterium]|nr:hypothetical protein [Patescibacteria group bacterium]